MKLLQAIKGDEKKSLNIQNIVIAKKYIFFYD